MKLSNLLVTSFCLLPMLVACSSDSDDGGSNLGPKPSNATRSDTCLSWQDATCDYLVDTCQSLTRASCDDSFQALFCKSDDTMQQCIDALPSGTCPDTPSACNGVADPAPAKWYCNSLVDKLCIRAEACGQGSKSSCVEEAKNLLDCDSAIGAGPQIETCLSAIESSSCDTLEAGLPEVCKGIIKRYETTSLHTSQPSSYSPLVSKIRWEQVSVAFPVLIDIPTK